MIIWSRYMSLRLLKYYNLYKFKSHNLFRKIWKNFLLEKLSKVEVKAKTLRKVSLIFLMLLPVNVNMAKNYLELIISIFASLSTFVLARLNFIFSEVCLSNLSAWLIVGSNVSKILNWLRFWNTWLPSFKCETTKK